MKRECFEQIFISKKNISHEIENYSLSKDPKFSRSKIFKRKFYTSSKTFFLSNRKSNKTIVKKTPKSLRFITRQIKLVRIQKFSRSKRKINSSIPQIVYTILYIFLSKTDSSNSPQNKIDKTPPFFFIESKIGLGNGKRRDVCGGANMAATAVGTWRAASRWPNVASLLRNSSSPVFTSRCVLKNRRVPTVTAHRWNIGSRHNTSNRASINT